MRSRIRLLAGLLLLLSTGCADNDTNVTGPAPAQPTKQPSFATTDLPASDRTPFQRSLMRAIAEREAAGLPVPARVRYEYDASSAPRFGVTAQGTGGGETVTARTVIEFENPEQAGLEEWPAVVVKGEVPENGHGFVKPGDYSEFIRDEIARQYPNSNVDLESGPRTYTFSETIVQNEPAPAEVSSALAFRLNSLESITAVDELLMGFTVLGPNVDYHLGFDVSICVFWFFGCHAEVQLVDFWAGYKMDWTIGMRLPMGMDVATEGPVLEGSTFPATTKATGLDWDAADYEQAGVSGEDGNEFLLKFVFKVGIFVSVLEVDVVDLGVDIELDRESSFTTPLGPGAMFSLQPIDLEVWGRHFSVVDASVGIALTPQIGSNQYTAGWINSAGGSGNLTYSQSGVAVPLANLAAVDGPGNATVELNGMRYYFNQFGLALGLYFDLRVLGYGGRWDVPVGQFDLGALMGGLYVGPHAGTPGAIQLSIPIQNVAPTVTLSRAGATLVNGVATFMASAGQPLSFSGDVTDPGQDDLTVSWDWGDGAPTPDETTLYPVPHELTVARTHTFGSACVYQVRLSAVDDDRASAEDVVAVVALGQRTGAARSEGWWQHQLNGNGATTFTAEGISCLLGVVEHMSGVFGELRVANTAAAAYDVIFLKQNGGSALQQLDRELMVAWLNYANGAFTGATATAVLEALAAAETLRADPAATEQALQRAAQALHRAAAGS